MAAFVANPSKCGRIFRATHFYGVCAGWPFLENTSLTIKGPRSVHLEAGTKSENSTRILSTHEAYHGMNGATCPHGRVSRVHRARSRQKSRGSAGVRKCDFLSPGARTWGIHLKRGAPSATGQDSDLLADPSTELNHRQDRRWEHSRCNAPWLLIRGR
jgi:hypothetical protein